MIKLSKAADLPPPGSGATEVLVCDLSHEDGRRALRNAFGNRLLRVLLHRIRFVAIGIRADGARTLAPYTLDSIAKLGADLIDLTARAPGPVVVMPFGLSRGLNEQLLAGARRRDLELAEPSGSA